MRSAQAACFYWTYIERFKWTDVCKIQTNVLMWLYTDLWICCRTDWVRFIACGFPWLGLLALVGVSRSWGGRLRISEFAMAIFGWHDGTTWVDVQSSKVSERRQRPTIDLCWYLCRARNGFAGQPSPNLISASVECRTRPKKRSETRRKEKKHGGIC